MVYSLEAEEQVLGYLFNPYVEKEKKLAFMQAIVPEYFFLERHRVIYKGLKLFETFDKIILWDKLQKGKVTQSFDIEFSDIAEIDEVVTEKDAESYAEILADRYQKRRLWEFGDHLKKAMEEGESQHEMAIKAQNLLLNLGSKAKIQTNQEILQEVLNEEPGDVLSTGFPQLDKYLGGYARGMIITIAGDSGQLKTTLALEKAFRMAECNKTIKIGVFSKEMLAKDLMKKQISRICKIPINTIYSQEYSKEDVKKKMMEVEPWRNNRIQIINPNSFTGVADIARLQMTHRFDVWFLDFIQLLEFAKAAGTSSDYNIQIGQNMRNLQSLALATKSVGIVLSQVKKGVELRKMKKPTVSDIEWSGLIKQLSSYIFFSYYPFKYYGEDKISNEDYFLIGEKTRFAESFTYPMHVDAKYGVFTEIADANERTSKNNKLKSLLDGDDYYRGQQMDFSKLKIS